MTRAFFRNAGLLASAEFLVRLKGFVIIPLLTHRFGAVGYGVWAQVAVLVALLGPVIMLGSDSGVIRYLPGTDRVERTRSFFGWMLAIAALSVVLCGLVALLRTPLAVVSFGTSHGYARFVPLAAASIMATILLNFARTWFRLENDAVRLSSITLGQAVLSTFALVAMFVRGQGIYALVLYSLLGDALLAVVMLLLIWRRTGAVAPDFSIMPRLVRYGVVLLPAGYAVWALNWADRIFLVHYASLRAVGIYSLAYSLGYLAIQVLVNPIWTMFPNAFAELWNLMRRDEAQRLFESTAGLIFVLVMPVIAGAAVIGDGLVGVLAPKAFVGAAPVIPLVLGGYLCFMLSAFYETAFGLVDRQGLGVATVGVACAVNIGLNFALIPPYSYIGAAVATLVAFAVELGLCLALSIRLGMLRTPLRLPLLATVAAFAMALVLLPLHDVFVGHGGLPLIGGMVVGAVVYGGLCRLLGVIQPGLVTVEARRLLRRDARPAPDPPIV